MKNNKTILVLIFVFSILIGGAGLLYNSLVSTVERDSFISLDSGKEIGKTDPSNSSVKNTDPVQDQEHSIDESQQSSEEELHPAPDFTIYDAEGNKVKLSDYIGKPVILNFWASWCGPCKSEMPGFDNLYKKYGDSIQFLMVNLTDGLQETQEKADTFIKNEGYSFPVYYDKDSDAAYVYEVSSIPTTYLINAEGYIEAYAIGAITEEALEGGIDILK